MAATAAATLAEVGWKLTPARMGAHLAPRDFKRYRHSDLLGRAYVDAVSGRRPFQIVNLQPQIGKTMVTSRWGPAWTLELRPWWRILLTSYAAELAEDNGRYVRNIFLTHADQLETRLAEDSQAKSRFHTEQGGGLVAVGLGGTITGRSAELIVVDDPHAGWEEAQSETMREKVWNAFQTDVMTRRQEGGAVLVVATRWHEDDLCGRLLEREAGRWHHIRIPSFAEPTPEQPDPLDRQPGELVCPERFSLAHMEEIRHHTSSFHFAGLYQQRPAPAEGGIFKRHWWRYYDAFPVHEMQQWLTSWDMSFKGSDDSDYVVGQVWARNGADKYLVDQVRAQLDYPATKKVVRNLAEKYPQCRLHLVEDAANGPAIIADLRNSVSGLVAVTPKGSKESRAHAVAGDVEAGNVWLPSPKRAPWIGEAVDELSSFPNAKNDDVADSLTQALLRWSNRDMLGQSEYSTVPARGRR